MHGSCNFANNILLFFSLSFTWLSLFLSSASTLTSLSFYLWSLTLTSLISEASRSKLATIDCCWSKLTRRLVLGFSIWSMGFGVLIFLILSLISFGIFCLINGFWGFDPFLFFVWSVGDGGWWSCLIMVLDDGGRVGWWWVWIKGGAIAWLGGDIAPQIFFFKKKLILCISIKTLNI